MIARSHARAFFCTVFELSRQIQASKTDETEMQIAEKHAFA